MILIATPTRDSITAGTATDLIGITRLHPDDTKFTAIPGIYIANLRNQAVTMARSLGASHLLFIDSDMRFPPSTLDRLLAADVAIVAANYAQRTMPIWSVARVEGKPFSSFGRHGLQSVESVGCGVMLISLGVFESLPKPWFDTPYSATYETQLGEDVFFCQQARANGFDVWIDHDLSNEVRHQAVTEYLTMPESREELVGA